MKKKIKGFFIKIKGRLTKKPRAFLNKKIIRYGKIGFSTIKNSIDYSFLSFINRWGVCSIKLWIVHFR